jgi:hypothetical protein
MLNGIAEMKRIWIYCVLIALLNVNYVKTASSTSAEWDVYAPNHKDICIRMEATIGLTLSYLAGNEESSKTVQVNVPSGLSVNNELSSCNTTVYFNETSVPSQVLHLDFPHDPAWSGWWIEFLFTTDSDQFHAGKTEFALYGVKVSANYTSQDKLFVGHKDSNYTYDQSFIHDSDTPSDIAADIFANKHYSYFCSSSVEYPINTDEGYGLKAWITLKKIRVQAYAPNGNTKYGDREICPQDQTSGDLIPVIVGGVLSGLVVITLIIYLVYRARQPPSVLYLTNPHSHFEDIGIKQNHGSIEDEEDEESINNVGAAESQRRIARHLQVQEHSNLGFEE